MNKQYFFISRWEIEADSQDVWKLIYESEKWPAWWKSVKCVDEIHKGDNNGVGSIRRYKIRSPMLYTLSFDLLLTHMQHNKLLRGDVSGELQGIGSWHFKQNAEICVVECRWQVTTKILWMNALSWLLKPVFKYNHVLVMKTGAKSLAKALRARLLKC